MKTRILLGTGLNPYRNLAFEESLVDRASTASPEETEAILFLWQNHDTVVIGANQNPWRECDLKAMDRDGVRLARRVTGGGAVFHDMGNLNFSFILPREQYDVTRQGRVILAALHKVGIQAEQTGRNDITVDGRKFSGNAFLHRRNASLHHGTLLIGADMSRLAGYLQVDPAKLAGKGVQSVRSRVVNLAELSPGLDAGRMITLVSEAFEEEYGASTDALHVELSDDSPLSDEVRMLAERNASWDWLYGKTPVFTMDLSTRFSWGGMEIGFETRKGYVVQAKVWSDCLMENLPPLMAKVMRDVPFHQKDLSDALLHVAAREDLVEPPEADALRDVSAWLAEHPF